MIVLRDADVSIHAPARGATRGWKDVENRTWKFQSTPPRGGRLIRGICMPLKNWFQSTPPRGGRPSRARRSATERSFNPRPRAGGDARLEGCREPHVEVSIHAPARGATHPRHLHAVEELVSIHAPARGATIQSAPIRNGEKFQSTPPRGGRPTDASRSGARCCFNPRPRAGGDASPRPSNTHEGVSIHAPARGATYPRRTFKVTHKFQSTPPRGGRPGPWRNPRRRGEFQSTPPRGGRQTDGQPRRRPVEVSIHAPARGATRLPGDRAPVVVVSIHAPARGATCAIRSVFRTSRFQSTPPRGGRPAQSDPCSGPPGFNPRPRAGGDSASKAHSSP